MKPEKKFSRTFIDLAQMGRTDWRSVASTILLVGLGSIVLFVPGAVGVFGVIDAVSPGFSKDQVNLRFVFGALDSAASIFGLWLACRNVLKRPFRSLISTDLTFNIPRCFLGAALYLPANILSLTAISLFFSMRIGAWGAPIRHFEWPHSHDQIVESMVKLIVIPLPAFAEELFFRAWLTQILGRYIRSTIAVVALVAVIFASYHSQYDLQGRFLVMLCSLGFSALSLRDQRLELAIGAHSMTNIQVSLQALFFAGSLPYVQSPLTTLDWWFMTVLKGALPYVLMYWFLEKMRGWSVPIDTRQVIAANVQPTQP